MTIREVREDDCRVLWEWANDPLTRAASYNSEPIPWDDHRSWFAEKLASRLYLALVDDQPVGHIRFARSDAAAVVGVVVSPDHRGEGLGAALIRRGTERFFSETGVERVDAFIKAENAASTRAFEKAGYALQEQCARNGVDSFRYASFSSAITD